MRPARGGCLRPVFSKIDLRWSWMVLGVMWSRSAISLVESPWQTSPVSACSCLVRP